MSCLNIYFLIKKYLQIKFILYKFILKNIKIEYVLRCHNIFNLN